MNETFNDIKKRWIDLLAIAIASGLTPSMIQWLGWKDNFWTFIVVFFVIAIAVGIVVGLIMALIKKNKE